MLRTIAWYSNFALSLAFTIPKLYKAKSLSRAGKTEALEEFVHNLSSRWAMSQVRMSGAKVTVHGEENIPKDIPVLFVSNHQSNFDIALFMSFINKPKGYISKIEMKKIPVLRTWMEYMHCVFMERGNLRKAVEAISEGIEILKEGYSLVLFPEGTRSKSDNMNEFKAGGFKLATKSKVPIVPVTIKGSYKLMEQNNSRIAPAKVEMYIHPMIETANLTREEEAALSEKVKSVIQSKL